MEDYKTRRMSRLLGMNPRTKFVGVGLTFFVVLIVLLSGLYLKRRSDDLTEQFRERSLWRAQVFAGVAPNHLSTNDWHELLSTIFTASDVLYAQVVYKGRVRAMHGSIPVPPARSLTKESLLYGSYAPQVLEANTAEGQEYLDILYPLALYSVGEPPDPESYVRLGLSREPLTQELRGEILLVVLVALVALALSWVIIWGLARHLFPETVPASQKKEEAVALAELGGNSSELVVDHAGKRVFLRGGELKLSPKEYELLCLLASEPGRVFSTEEILQAVWAGRQWATAQDVKQYIYFLRRKLEADPENPKFIITVRGFGYKLNLD